MPRATPTPPTRGRRQIDDSDDDFAPTPPRANRQIGRGGRGNRGRPSSSRVVPRAQTASATRGRGRASTSTRGGRMGPIFGGRQNDLVDIAAHFRSHLQRPTHSGSRQMIQHRQPLVSFRSAEGIASHIIRMIGAHDRARADDEDFDDDDDEDEEDEEEEEELDEDQYEASFIDDDGADDTINLNDTEEIDHSDDDDETEMNNPEDETFSQEIEEFELMDERENKAVQRKEDRLRKKEDKEEKENKNVLRTDMFGACTVCAEDEVPDPVGCIYCAGFIGCRKCANRWYRTSKKNESDKIASCPMCRHKWDSDGPVVDDMLNLVKFA